MKSDTNNVIGSYDITAKDYADKFYDELSKKPFDRMLLKSFAENNRSRLPAVDFGCGPGHTTNYLKRYGLKKITGIDISKEMVKVAKRKNKTIRFEQGDMLRLNYENEFFGTAAALYSIVNFNRKELIKAFAEIKRVLKPGSQFLISFHIGNKKVHIDTFLDKRVSIDFYFYRSETIMNLLKASGFEIITSMERFPYGNAEYPSKRGYIISEAG